MSAGKNGDIPDLSGDASPEEPDRTPFRRRTAGALYIAAAVLFVLHQDFWLWGDRTLVLGAIPSGLLYHLAYCLAASALLWALVRFAWPHHLDAEPGPAAKGETPWR